MSGKVQFETNIPVEVALKYGDGKDVSGQYGNQVLYTITDGRVLYVPPIVRERIAELGIGRGELFTLTKAEKQNGTRRTIEWVLPVRRPNHESRLIRRAAGRGTGQFCVPCRQVDGGATLRDQWLAPAAGILRVAKINRSKSAYTGIQRKRLKIKQFGRLISA